MRNMHVSQITVASNLACAGVGERCFSIRELKKLSMLSCHLYVLLNNGSLFAYRIGSAIQPKLVWSSGCKFTPPTDCPLPRQRQVSRAKGVLELSCSRPLAANSARFFQAFFFPVLIRLRARLPWAKAAGILSGRPRLPHCLASLKLFCLFCLCLQEHRAVPSKTGKDRRLGQGLESSFFVLQPQHQPMFRHSVVRMPSTWPRPWTLGPLTLPIPMLDGSCHVQLV